MAAATVISGKDSDGVERIIKTTNDGTVVTSGGGGGGAGDASAANQTLQITAANSTNTKLDTVNTNLGTLDGHVDGLETLVTSSNTKLDTLHTDSAAILAKLLAAPATEAKQDTGNTSLATLITQTDGIEGSLSNLDTNTGAIADAAVTAGATGSISAKLRAISRDIISNIVLKAGSAIIGQVSVDQTTPGTTDSVTVKASVGIGSLTEGAPASDTASSGLNGRLQRIAQNITTLIASALTVVGNVASGASDSGNPVKIGGKYNSTKPTLTNGQRGDTQVEINGATTVALYGKVTNPGDTPILLDSTGNNVRTQIYSGATNLSNAITPSDALSNSTALGTVSMGLLWSGANWQLSRNVNATTLLASAARTVTTNSSDQTNYNHRGFLLVVDISSIGTGSITPTIQVKDSISANYKTIWTAAAALIANGTYVYPVYPGSLGAASFTEIVNAIVGRTWRLAMTANNANSVTYSVSADMEL